MVVRRLVRRCTGLALFALVALTPSPASAQLDRGQIAGFIKDRTGGLIPGATITATHAQTGVVRTVVTDGTGYYVFTAVTPGVYDVVVELQGFKKWMQTGVPMDAGASLKVDATLETGTINESVTVIAMATPLQTDVTLRKTVQAQDIELLPFSGRIPIDVVGLKAGVFGGAFNSRGFDDLGNGGFNINGSPAGEDQIPLAGPVGVRPLATGTSFGGQHI